MRQSEIIEFYSRPEISKEIARSSHSREAAVRLQGGIFASRPNTIDFPTDVKTFARRGATSFHISEERWANPLQLSSTATLKELDTLRSGWDLVFDIDCKFIEYGTIAAKLLLKAIKEHKIECASLKFSGGTGWHIAIPFESLPKEINGKKIELLFPEAPRIVAQYLKEFIREKLSEEILDYEKDLKMICEKTGKKREELVQKGEFNPYKILEIDTILISSRHLFRAPYSLNEKTWLVSIVIKEDKIDSFKLEDAKPENIKEVDSSFLVCDEKDYATARRLLVAAYDSKAEKDEEERRQQSKKKGKARSYEELTEKIPEEKFPPCITLILKGLDDGKKRSLFILLNFLRSVKWGWKEIEDLIEEWNKKNAEPLKVGYIRSQINWHKRQEKVLPPNCASEQYYKDIGICKPDSKCRNVKNPVPYCSLSRRVSKST